MKLAEALRQAYPGILIGPSKDEGEVILSGGRIVYWNRPEPKPDEAAVMAAYDPLPVAKAGRIASINAECRARLLARFGDPAEQVSRSIGVYGLAEKSALETGIAATIDASNTASDAVTAATTVEAVEAVTVTWPAI